MMKFRGLISILSLVFLNALHAAEPTVAPSNIVVSNIQCTQASISWTNGNGGWRLVVVKEASANNAVPTDGIAYTAFATFMAGDDIGSANYACWNNINNSFLLKGLKANTKYYVAVFEHDGAASPNYLTSSYATSSFTTQNLVLDFSFDYKDSCDKTNKVTFTNKSTATYTGITYTWLFQDGNTGTGTNVTHTYNTGGNYLVTLIAAPALGCTDNFTQTKAVFIIPRPVSKPIEQNNKLNQCLNGNHFYFDDQTTLAKIPKCAYTRTWYFSASDSATIPKPNKVYTAGGTYRVLYKSETYYDSRKTGCTDTASLVIRVIPDPASGISINKYVQCFNGNSFVFNNIYPGLSSFFWDLGDGVTSTNQTITHKYASVGTYPIIHEAKSPEGCASKDTVYVSVKNNKTATFTGIPASVCENGKSFTLVPNDPSGVFTVSSGKIVGTTYYPGKAGTQLIKFVVSDSFCPDSVVTPFTISTLPKFNLGKDTVICDNSSVDLIVPVAGTLTWEDGTNVNPRTIVNSGRFVATVDNNGCSWTDTINIGALTTPQVTLPGDTLICQGSMVQLTANWPSSKVTWSNGTTGNTIYVDKAGLYTVTVSNSCGNATDDILVTTSDGFCDVFIPDAFTPNGDNRNEYFEIIGRGITPTQLMIYTRWGEKVFDSKTRVGMADPTTGIPYTETSPEVFQWNGYYNGALCQAGSYIFHFRYEQKVGDRVRRNTVNGTVMVLR